MISVIIEAVWLAVKKLFRYFGFAAVLFIVLFICALALPDYAREEAEFQAMYERSVDFISLDETEPVDGSRIFKLRFKNNDSNALNVFSFTVRDEDGNIIYAYFTSVYEDLQIHRSPVYVYATPPGCENFVYFSIDDYKLEGIDKLYLSEDTTYSQKNLGTGFDI